MRTRDVSMICSCVISLLFSIPTLIAGSKKGVLNSVAIMTYMYGGNQTLINEADNWETSANSTDPVVQALSRPPYNDDGMYDWFFEIHYLSICAGDSGGSETEFFYHLNCSFRPGSYKFRTDDPFIVNYQAIGGEYPVEPGPPDMSFDLRPPFACLVLGIIFTILSLVVLICELCGWGRWSDLSLVCVGVTMLASIFLMVSSALITSIVMRSYDDKQDFQGWTTNFLGLSWTGVGFMYCAFVFKALDVVMTKEKRRRLLTTGQI